MVVSTTEKNYINLYKISYLIYLTFNNRFHEEITFLLNILVRILRDFEKSIRIVTSNNQMQYRFEDSDIAIRDYRYFSRFRPNSSDPFRARNLEYSYIF